MSLSDEVRDPWGVLVAGVSGGMAWALLGTAVGGPVAVAAGVGVGAAVLGVKAFTGLLLGRPAQVRAARPVRPPRGTAAGAWFAQTESAVRTLDDLAGTAPAGPTGTAVRAAAEDADDALLALGRVGAQVTAVGQSGSFVARKSGIRVADTRQTAGPGRPAPAPAKEAAP